MWSQIWIFMVIVYGSFHLICSTVESSSEADKIQSLPGQPEVSFQQFGGYIHVDDKHQRALFYYFVEAETNPASKPLILWLNGGPGCSSIGVGAFTEHGPFTTNFGQSITKNKYSWNREANVLYLESPAGVGFSYSTDKSFFKTLNDDITARDNMVFLQRWLAKFPQYKNNEFYIMGESYAGHYVPQLAELIVKSKVNINLKGIAIDDEYSELDYIDLYYVIGDKCLSYNLSQAAILTHRRRSSISQIFRTLNMQKDGKTHQYHQELDNCPLKNAEMYLNRKEVQKALHARLVGVNNYHLCSPREDEEIPTINIVGWLIKSGLKVIVYSGDQDSVVPFIGTRRLVDKLAKRLGLKTTVPYSAWFVGKQVGGWTQVYGDHDLTYATIRGASHSTPTTQPKRSFVLFDSFLRGKRLPKA
ncbi:Serine carboxypeptidase, serine active site [Sesbania bispinosa]|nr:Serine carboxypeptidase, serine active site [Sesbania bispinosa]